MHETVKAQTLASDIKIATALSPGPLVTYQKHKKYGSRAMCSVVQPEFETCAANLTQYRDYVTIRVPWSAKQVGLLLKKTPSIWHYDALCAEDFQERKNPPLNVLITGNILQALSSAGNYVD